MDIHTFTRELHVKNSTKIVMYVGDGLGGLPQQPGGRTELETANTPNLDALAKAGVLPPRKPITGCFRGWAATENGQLAAASPIKLINSRRFMTRARSAA